MNLSCLFGRHKWEKMGGAENVGSGKFRIRLVCKKCNKIKEVIK